MSVWVEICGKCKALFDSASRSTWACELKWPYQSRGLEGARSRSTWACELKWFFHAVSWWISCVTLHVSVWVEINFDVTQEIVWYRHAPRERVSWNVKLWQQCQVLICHAPRERVSWNHLILNGQGIYYRHAPRERVSWNLCQDLQKMYLCVTLHVSVWVEIGANNRLIHIYLVTLHVSVWVEIFH